MKSAFTTRCCVHQTGAQDLIAAFANDGGRVPRMAESQVDARTRVSTNHINSAITILILFSPDGSPRPNRGFRHKLRQGPQNGRNTGWCTHKSIYEAIEFCVHDSMLCSPDGSPRPNRGFRQRWRQGPQNGRYIGLFTNEILFMSDEVCVHDSMLWSPDGSPRPNRGFRHQSRQGSQCGISQRLSWGLYEVVVVIARLGTLFVLRCFFLVCSRCRLISIKSRMQSLLSCWILDVTCVVERSRIFGS